MSVKCKDCQYVIPHPNSTNEGPFACDFPMPANLVHAIKSISNGYTHHSISYYRVDADHTCGLSKLSSK